jgi:hypothetical protein
MDEMQEMLEHYRITKLVNLYCHGCDRLDGERMASVYAEDSWDDHGNLKMDGHSFAQAIIKQRIERKDVMSHHLGQTLVTIDGDRAGAETYFIATVRRMHKGEMLLLHLGGRYVDELVRIDGQWKVEKRLTVRDWSIAHPIESDPMGTIGFIEGQTNGSDPSFATLRFTHSGNPGLNVS